jgi:hypothetical protein
MDIFTYVRIIMHLYMQKIFTACILRLTTYISLSLTCMYTYSIIIRKHSINTASHGISCPIPAHLPHMHKWCHTCTNGIVQNTISLSPMYTYKTLIRKHVHKYCSLRHLSCRIPPHSPPATHIHRYRTTGTHSLSHTCTHTHKHVHKYCSLRHLFGQSPSQLPHTHTHTHTHAHIHTNTCINTAPYGISSVKVLPSCHTHTAPVPSPAANISPSFPPNAREYTFDPVRVCMYIRVCMCVFSCTRYITFVPAKFSRIVCVYACLCVCMQTIFMCACMLAIYTHIHSCIHFHTHTHTHTYLQASAMFPTGAFVILNIPHK